MKGQASVLTMIIMTALALVISLAIWNLFMSTASIQSEQALTVSTLARESARISVVELSSVKVNSSNPKYRFAFQISTLDYQPVTLYLMILHSVTTSPKPTSFTLYELASPSADIADTSTLILISNSTVNEKANSDNVMIRPVNSNEYAPLSIYYDATITPYRIFLPGEPKCYIIEVSADAVSDYAQLVILIKINNKYYQIATLPLS